MKRTRGISIDRLSNVALYGTAVLSAFATAAFYAIPGFAGIVVAALAIRVAVGFVGARDDPRETASRLAPPDDP
jgi:hypothetical protein